MATVKIALKNKSNKDGKFPVVFRINHDGKTAEVSSKVYIQKSEWSTNSNMVNSKHSKYKELKSFFIDLQDRLYDEINLLQTTQEVFTAAAVKENFEVKVEAKKNNIKRNNFDFIAFLKNWVSNHKETNSGNAKVTNDTANSLKKFGYETLPFIEITPTFVFRYNQWLSKTHKTTSTRIRSFKARYNEAVKMGLGDDQKPFSTVAVSSKVVKAHEYLTTDEMDKLKNFKHEKHGNLLYHIVHLCSLITDLV